jgi:hypothetical protein
MEENNTKITTLAHIASAGKFALGRGVDVVRRKERR